MGIAVAWVNTLYFYTAKWLLGLKLGRPRIPKSYLRILNYILNLLFDDMKQPPTQNKQTNKSTKQHIDIDNILNVNIYGPSPPCNSLN